MSFEKLIEQIKKETEERVNSILQQARKQAEGNIEQAKIEAEEIIKSAKDKAKKEYDEGKEREISKINSEGKMEVLKAINNAYQESIDILLSAKDDIAKDQRYESLINKMIELSHAILGEDCIIYTNKKYLKHLKGNIKDKEIFGVYAESSDGKRNLDLTIDSLILNNQSLKQKILEKIKGKIEK